jgi:PilZ domain-containing protein
MAHRAESLGPTPFDYVSEPLLDGNYSALSSVDCIPRSRQVTSKAENLIYSFIKDNYGDFQFHFVEGCGKTAVQQLVLNQPICLKYIGGPLIERRRAKRFQVDWQIRAEGVEYGGRNSAETGMLRNISSGGALLTLAKPVSTGTRLDIYIKLPVNGKKWMKYPASVVRVQRNSKEITAAVKFDSARPDFGTPLLPV